MIELKIDGDTWRILAEGATRNGKTYCHLASTTRFNEQRNGKVPVQMGCWIENNVILSAAMQAEEEQRRQAAITSYYTDRANSGLAALAK